MSATMPFDELEKSYELLADAIDRAGPDGEALFLAKLALALAHRLGDVGQFRECVRIALADLSAREDIHPNG